MELGRGWRVEGGGWRVEGGGWSMKAKVLCVMVRRLKVGGIGGWRVEGGG